MALAFCFWVVVWEGVRARKPNFAPKKKPTSWREVENNKEKYKLGDDHHHHNNNQHHHLDRT